MFYATIAANMDPGSGYYEVHADDYEEALKLTFAARGDKWCFLYMSLEDMHELDRTKLGEIHAPGVIYNPA